MQNTIQFESSRSKKLTFDLKGSQINRYTKPDQKFFWRQSLSCKQVLKDLNLQEI